MAHAERHIVGYPARLAAVDVGERNIEIFVVDDLEKFVDRAALLRDGEAAEPPYWAHLWAGSRALAARIMDLPEGYGSALDLGCGLGLAGLAAAGRGARTTFLDRSLQALHFARASTAHNRLPGAYVQGDVGRTPVRGRFDLCLAADVTYDPPLHQAVAELLAACLAPAGVALCAESVRTADSGFVAACRDRALRCSERWIRVTDEGRPALVRLLEMRR